MVVRLETHAKQKAERANEKEKKNDEQKKHKKQAVSFWALYMFVAIPLPGTGAWTGALIADLFDIRVKHSLPVIAAGVLVAGLIVSALSYGLFGALGF